MSVTTHNGSAPRESAHAASSRESVWRVALASMVGTSIEWYDFFIFGAASALVFGRLFFPNVSELAGTLAAFATFAVGFVARPVGGLVFGHFGDRLGRKTMLARATRHTDSRGDAASADSRGAELFCVVTLIAWCPLLCW